MTAPRLWITDFDGTVKPFGEPVSPADIEALAALGRLGAVRAVATGRSIHTFMRDWPRDMELDYLISSSGLAVSRFGPEGPGELLSSREFTPEQARQAVDAAEDAGLGFFAALPPPETHRSFYRSPPGPAPTCFGQRVAHSEGHAVPWEGMEGLRLAQLVVMGDPPRVREAEGLFRRRCPGLSTVVSGSPYGDGALWLEVYPQGVSKGRAAAGLADSLGLGPEDAVALGNDFNDQDLLEWAGRAFVSSEAPEALRSLFRTAPPAGRAPLAYVAGRLVPGLFSV
jgi:hydroxymethylpyrimidine pyrophosphatase-like HAD family hydrolase